MNVRKIAWMALLVAAAVMVGTWLAQKYTDSQRPKPPATGPASAGAAATSALAASTPATAVAATSWPAVTIAPATTGATTAAATTSAPAVDNWQLVPRARLEEVTLGSLDRKSGYMLAAQLVSRGAAVETIKLSEYFATVKDNKRFLKDPATYDEALAKGEDTLKGYYPLLNPVVRPPTPPGFAPPPGVPPQVDPLATARIVLFTEDGPKDGVGVPLYWNRLATNAYTTPVYWQLVPESVRKDAGVVTAVTFQTTVTHNGASLVRIEKTYSLDKGSYSMIVGLKLTNLSTAKLTATLTQLGPTGVPRADPRTDDRSMKFGKYDGSAVKVDKVDISAAQKNPPGLEAAKGIGSTGEQKPVVWLGQVNKFFASIVYVQPATSDAIVPDNAKVEFKVADFSETATWLTQTAALQAGPYDLAPNASQELNLNVFAGPKLRSLFEGSPLYARLNYRDTLDLGACCAPSVLTLGMMWLLDVFFKFTHNYGVAIILLVILVRLLLHPLTKKGQVSMAKMQKLQPEIAKLREKYKDDKAKLNEEMMKFYRTQGTGGFLLGCLPMALQMPIWVALWSGLNASVELRQAGFLPWWITDLAAPDAIMSWAEPIYLPLVSGMAGPINSLNLLPLLLTVAMVLQQKLMPSTPQTANPNDPAAKQQKMMMWMMPVFMLLLFYNAPSGLTLYIMASTFAGVVESYVIRKHIRERDAQQASVETRVDMPGKGFRGERPKKPKGPFGR